VSLVTQYDLEVFLRIETALGKKLEQYQVEKDDVLLLHERVGQAQHEAATKMKEFNTTSHKKGKRGAKNVWGVKNGRIEKDSEN
jgi:ATP-dependent RNA helicase DDX47/RRP3